MRNIRRNRSGPTLLVNSEKLSWHGAFSNPRTGSQVCSCRRMLDSFRQEEICLIFWNIKALSMATGEYGGLLLRPEYASKSTGSTDLRSRPWKRATIEGSESPIRCAGDFSSEGSVPSIGIVLRGGTRTRNLSRPESCHVATTWQSHGLKSIGVTTSTSSDNRVGILSRHL